MVMFVFFHILVDKVLNFMENDLNICITEENKKLVIQKFYSDIEDIFYWSCEIESSFYEELTLHIIYIDIF